MPVVDLSRKGEHHWRRSLQNLANNVRREKLIIIFVIIWLSIMCLLMKFKSFFWINLCNSKTDLFFERKKFENIVIAFAFNYKSDPLHKTNRTGDNFKYIKSWYESIHKLEGMKGIILGNMFTENFMKQYADEQVDFLYINPETHTSFLDNPSSERRTINDQVYFVAEWYLNSTKEKYDYALITDLHDIKFRRDPFNLIMAIDRSINKPQLYVQDEYQPFENNLKWISRVWNNCFSEKFDHGQLIYNSGIVGGRVDKLLLFLHQMNALFDSIPEEKQHLNCNMAVFAHVIFHQYDSNVIHGYPFHHKFRQPYVHSRDDGVFIQHKGH